MRQSNETEQWLLEQARANLLTRTTDLVPEEVRRFSKTFWPFMEPYYSTLQPIFSFELQSQLLKERSWLLKDGAIPLSWFFEKVPTATGEIIIHADLGTLVPKAWKKSTKYYELYSHKIFHADQPPKQLFLAGPVNPGILTLDELDNLLDQTIEAIGGSELETVFVYCPIRQNSYVLAEEESYEFQFYHRIFSRFGKKAHFLHWHMLEHASFRETAYVDLSAGWYYSDSYVAHQVLKAGAGLLSSAEKREGDLRRVPLSRYHGMEVSTAPREPSFTSLGRQQDILEFYSSLHNKIADQGGNIPWPRWYEGAFRASQKQTRA